MRESILRPNSYDFARKLKQRRWLCLLTALVAVGLHILFVWLRTDENHKHMLQANILTDSVLGCFLVAYISDRVIPSEKLCRLTARPAQSLTGVVTAISAYTVRYMDMDCLEVTLDSRKIFLPVNTIQLQVGNTATFKEVAGVITEVEYAKNAYAI